MAKVSTVFHTAGDLISYCSLNNHSISYIYSKNIHPSVGNIISLYQVTINSKRADRLSFRYGLLNHFWVNCHCTTSVYKKVKCDINVFGVLFVMLKRQKNA